MNDHNTQNTSDASGASHSPAASAPGASAQQAENHTNTEDCSIDPGSFNQKKPANKILLYVTRIVFSIAIFYFIFQRIDTAELWSIISKVHWGYMGTAVIMIIIIGLPSARAWQILADSQKIKLPFLYFAYMNLIGLFFNTTIPTGAGGDIWRCYMVSKISGNPPGGAASLILERITAFGSIVLLGLISFLLNIDTLAKAGILTGVSLFFAIVITAFLVFIVTGPLIIKKAGNFFDRKIPILSKFSLSKSLEIYGKNKKAVITALLLTTLSPLTECFTYIIIMLSLGLRPSFLPIFIMVPLLRFVNRIPISVNALGTQDLAMIIFWQPLGLSAPEAVSVSIIMHLLRLTVGGIGGILYIISPFKEAKEKEPREKPLNEDGQIIEE